ncbi:molybdenum cofactor guanylyltransferase [Deferribacter autotrophicus]|uniref:Probable molybdenum cofactor guanylyltransferase n=1 Tax=Deferribacter autotrophicus TaxID=500465 RepID=A0A5A8F7Y6_9BACT|nr:molybdenum cofactor guanylyltransferase [Deferribacter autotrophicus]KAA0258118.1 molybdenum cofactor guanylyltransferase [Deferribacter autotrophicus]
MEISCAILAGGQSRRFGSDKTVAKLCGYSFTEILSIKLSKISSDVMVISKDNSKFDFKYKNVRFVNDEFEAQCPLVGIITALENAVNEWVFITSADSPLLKVEIIDLLYNHLGNYDVLLPVIDGKIYTLTGFYNKRILNILLDYFRKGIYRLLDIYPELNISYFNDVGKIKKVDTNLLSFININTKGDYEYAKEIAEKVGLGI